MGDLGHIAHLTPRSTIAIVLCADFAGPIFELAKNLDALLVRVLVGDAGSERLHVVNRRDTSIDESGVWRFKTLFRCETV
ncbi:hypothetical protein C463_14455 [Halorubrum californiense DSM 19288]|uniref:Uncharacterized protein n=1 Tax=Halorubrum californiense DSM 19288 TaxID=1227465 RepID=M0DZ65_9EURY|nr:hypothetical protein C463_14455 [Halorubrum californiense DSM 19288]